VVPSAAEPWPRVRKSRTPIFTAEQFVSAMKTVGQAFTAVNASLGRNEFEDSKAYLAISRDRLATTITFWRGQKEGRRHQMLGTPWRSSTISMPRFPWTRSIPPLWLPA